MPIRKKSHSGTREISPSPREIRNRSFARRAAAEGMVLLKNDHQLLPLIEGKRLALFGGGAVHTIKGGTGSGDVNERENVSIWQGLKAAGFEITTEKWLTEYGQIFKEARNHWREEITREAGGKNGSQFFAVYAAHPFQMPAGRRITDQDIRNGCTDTAVFVISRIAGEAKDRYAREGDYYLASGEKENLEFVCKNYDHVILIINTGAQIDLSFLKKYPNIEAALYMVQAGMEGGNALADLLCGRVVPSGKLTDTWAARYEDYPAAAAFSHNNGNLLKEYYEEGIYVGYRYFQSFGVSPVYPFGYGLSYTTFHIEPGKEPVQTDCREQRVQVSAVIKNTGARFPGKEVVQIYASCPQTGLPKELLRLCAFGKTRLLKPQEKQEICISFPVKALASFDERKSAWVVEKGLYGIWIGNSSENLRLAGAISTEGGVLEKTGHICPCQEPLKELVRPENRALEFEKQWHADLRQEGLSNVRLEVKQELLPEEEVPGGESPAARLAAVLTREELISLVMGEVGKGQSQAAENALGSAGIMVPGAAGETTSCLEEKYGVPGVSMADGPAGLRLTPSYQVSREGFTYSQGLFGALEHGFFTEREPREDAITYYQYATAIPVGTLLAQSFDPELLEEAGRAVAQEMEEFHISWWLAPGMNIHRDPLCGRNFEYYSEDPVVSGVMAAAITRGVQSGKGVGTTIKHFACNNQEDNRKGSDSVVSERTLRELYLRGFEIAVKTAQPMAIMTSYNLLNGIHTANSRDLCTVTARQEWGFRGIIMTDWTTTGPGGGSVPHLCVKAGNDLIMPGNPEDKEELAEALEKGLLEREELEACAERLLRLIGCSSCFQEAESYLGRFPEIRPYLEIWEPGEKQLEGKNGSPHKIVS